MAGGAVEGTLAADGCLVGRVESGEVRECVHVSNQSQIENESPEGPVVGELFEMVQTSLSELRLQLAHAQVNRGGCCTLFSNTRSHQYCVCTCDQENAFERKQARGTCSKYTCGTF